MKRFLLLILFAIVPALNAAQNTDADFSAVAEEFIKGYLNARPLLATQLGFHEYDGRADDFSRLALDAELQRLRRFEDRLRKFEPEELNARNGIDLRVLHAAIANEASVTAKPFFEHCGFRVVASQIVQVRGVDTPDFRMEHAL